MLDFTTYCNGMQSRKHSSLTNTKELNTLSGTTVFCCISEHNITICQKGINMIVEMLFILQAW